MDITLPSGRTITDVPEGTTQKALLDRLARGGGYEDDVRDMQLAISKPIGKEGFDQAAKEVAGKTGAIGRGLQGVGETFDRYAYGLKGLFTDLDPEEKQRLAQNKALVEHGGAAGTVGQIAGDLAITGPAMAFGGAAAPVVRALPMATRALRAAEVIPGVTTAARTAAVVGPGAAAGALSSPEDRETGAIYGGVGGLAGGALNRAVGGVLRPLVSREGKELMTQGVQPTPGQAVGGWVGKAEESLKSVPILGDMIAKARNRAIGEFNQATAGRAAQEIGVPGATPRAAGRALGEVGDEAMLNLRAKTSDVFENVLGQVPRVTVNPEVLGRSVAEITSDAGLDLTSASAKRLTDYVEKNIVGRMQKLVGEGGELAVNGNVAARIESDMGKAAANARSSSVGEERAYGQALSRLQEAWHDSFLASLPTEAQAALSGARRAWRALRPLDEAAAAAPSQQRGGVFTPRVLRSALAKADKSQSDNVLRTIQQQPVAQAANPYEYAASMSRAGRALGDVVPDSGTPGRLMTAAAGGAALGGALATGGKALVLAAPVLAAYTRMGSQLLTSGVFPQSREALATWLAKQGVPRNAIPQIVQRSFELAGRQPAVQQSNALPQAMQAAQGY